MIKLILEEGWSAAAAAVKIVSQTMIKGLWKESQDLISASGFHNLTIVQDKFYQDN